VPNEARSAVITAPPYGRLAAYALTRTGQIELAAVVTRGRPTQATEVSQMQSTTRAAHTRRHLSRHERQRHPRAEAFSRRSATAQVVPPPVKLATEDLELIDQLVRGDRLAALAIGSAGMAYGLRCWVNGGSRSGVIGLVATPRRGLFVGVVRRRWGG
jgi:hypothetical protein